MNQIGQNVSDAKGELTLKAYKKVNETLDVGPIEVKVKEMKVMHATPDYSMIDFFHGYTHDEDFDIVKVNVEIKNNSDKKIKFSPVAFLETDRGEHLTWEDEIYLEELTGEIEGNGSKSGNIGFILNDGNKRAYPSCQVMRWMTKGKSLQKASQLNSLFKGYV